MRYGFHLTQRLVFRRHNVYSRRVYAAMSEQIGKLRYILGHFIKQLCEKLSEIVREYLAFFNARPYAEVFKLSPNITAIYGVAVSRAEDDPRRYPRPFRIAQQSFSKLRCNHHRAHLVLAADLHIALFERLDREIFKLRYPYPRTGKRFHIRHSRGLPAAPDLSLKNSLLLRLLSSDL